MNRYVVQFCSAPMAGQHPHLDAALLLISNSCSGLKKKKKKEKEKGKPGPCDSSNRASEMSNRRNVIQEGHRERRFLHISFINIMKSPSVGKGRERMGRRRISAVSFIPWADLKIQVKKKKVRESLF